MQICRSNSDELATRAADVPLQAHTQIEVEQGDCCVVVVNGQIVGRMEAGRWTLQQYPFCGPLLADPNSQKDFFFCYLRPFGPMKVGGAVTTAQGRARVFGEAVVVVQDPARYVQGVVGSSGADSTAWITQTIAKTLTQVVGVMAASTSIDQLPVETIAQSLAQQVGPTLGQVGVAFQQLTTFNVAADGQGAAVGAQAKASRLEVVAKLAARVSAESPDPKVSKWETFGLFVAADPVAICQYSGIQPGWRWLCRGAGPMMQHTHGWPLAPNGTTSDHFGTEEDARTYYAALRQHALASMPGITPQDTRESFTLNSPSSYAETLWANGHEVLRLIVDRIEDMQALAHETDNIGIFPAGPPQHGPSRPIITYKLNDKANVVYVAAKRGPTGAADHVVFVYSDKEQPAPTITDGLPRAEWMQKFEHAEMQFEGDVLVAQWGRFSGAEVLAGEDQQNPVASLRAKLGQQIAIPLQPSSEAAARLGDAHAACAISMEPGKYSLHFYALNTEQHGRFEAAAISRDGAESFLPDDVVGNAGGVSFGGLGVEQYAMLSTERDNLIMRLGPMAGQSQEMSVLCAKYGIQNSGDGMAGRINDWEQYLTNDPAFSAQWAMQRGIAMARLQGHEPDAQQLAAMAAQQNMTQQVLEQGVANADLLRDNAIQLIQGASNRAPHEIIGMIQQSFPQFTPEDVLYKALRILREPDEFGRFDNVETCLEGLARAHYQTKSPEDQKFEGSEDKFFKEERDVIYSAYDIEVPGFFSKLFS